MLAIGDYNNWDDAMESKVRAIKLLTFADVARGQEQQSRKPTTKSLKVAKKAATRRRKR